MGFDKFWQSYPRKVAKGAALKAWKKIKPDAELTASILQAIEAQKRHRSRVQELNEQLPKGKQIFIPDWKHPATWLNAMCWLDEVPETETKKEKTRVQCVDCGGDYKVKFRGTPYCTRCYDKHAHPELRLA